MPFFIPAMAGGLLAARSAFALGSIGRVASTFVRSPIIQGGTFGVGYTGGAYAGYGVSNTWDPLRLHQTYKHPQSRQFKMPYGSYGRRRYSRYSGRSRYSGYTRYRRYRRYRRRSYYRRSYY